MVVKKAKFKDLKTSFYIFICIQVFITSAKLFEIYFRFKVKDWKPTEGIRYVTMLYGALSVMSMLAAGYFFHDELKSSKKSPAESRDLNKPCTIMIFDNHDLWHFLSAGGEYTSFLYPF